MHSLLEKAEDNVHTSNLNMMKFHEESHRLHYQVAEFLFQMESITTSNGVDLDPDHHEPENLTREVGSLIVKLKTITRVLIKTRTCFFLYLLAKSIMRSNASWLQMLQQIKCLGTGTPVREIEESIFSDDFCRDALMSNF